MASNREVPRREIRVLSLAGGGFLGRYTAHVRQALEARAGMPLARCFDLIAGTSIGAVLALALADEVPMVRLVRLFTDHGPRVFSSRALPAGAVGRLSEGRLILTLIPVQQQHVQAMMEDRLAGRYLRLDADWPAEAGLGIDIATPDASRQLAALAKSALKATEAAALAHFLEPVGKAHAQHTGATR